MQGELRVRQLSLKCLVHHGLHNDGNAKQGHRDVQPPPIPPATWSQAESGLKKSTYIPSTNIKVDSRRISVKLIKTVNDSVAGGAAEMIATGELCKRIGAIEGKFDCASLTTGEPLVNRNLSSEFA